MESRSGDGANRWREKHDSHGCRTSVLSHACASYPALHTALPCPKKKERKWKRRRLCFSFLSCLPLEQSKRLPLVPTWAKRYHVHCTYMHRGMHPPTFLAPYNFAHACLPCLAWHALLFLIPFFHPCTEVHRLHFKPSTWGKKEGIMKQEETKMDDRTRCLLALTRVGWKK